MTPPQLLPTVAEALAAHGVAHEVLACDPDLADTAAFCAHYGFDLGTAANTIVVSSKKVEPPRVCACVVLGTTRLDVNKRVAGLLGVKRLSFADAELTRELTGMMIGGVTVPGLPPMPVYLDAAVLGMPQVVMGGGDRSSKLLLDPHELLKLPAVEVVEALALSRPDTLG